MRAAKEGGLGWGGAGGRGLCLRCGRGLGGFGGSLGWENWVLGRAFGIEVMGSWGRGGLLGSEE